MYLIILCIIIICNIHSINTAEIITFSATLFNIPTITNDSVTLNVELANCSLPCACDVQTNETGDFASVKFLASTMKGSVVIRNLQPYTFYSFDINCSEVTTAKTYAVRTDVFRPSPPRNTMITLHGQRLQLQWTPPVLPQGPIDAYRVYVDETEVEPFLKNTELAYEMNEDYVPGATHIMGVRACNIDTQNRTLCSNLKDAETWYPADNITDSSTLMPTQSAYTPKISFLCIFFIQALMVMEFK